MISPDSIQLVKDAARIEEVIGDFIHLKRRGVNLIGACPFHDEKTASFTVSPAKGIYKCFGCGVSGDPITFVMKYEALQYPDAIRYIAKKYNIHIEETETTEEFRQEQSIKEALYAINEFAERHFIDNLINQEQGKTIALPYLIERGFTEATIKKFKLGYAIDDYRNLLTAATEKGFKQEYLQTLGLVSSSENPADSYRDRIIFPIHNITGRIIGFAARILKSNVKQPKYINSPETDIYIKNQNIYGIYFAKPSIIKQNKCYLVEGYTDVISLHQNGLENVVSSSGTSLTTGQIDFIKRFTNNITILFDGDSAGIKASFRGIDMILMAGMNVRIVLFPPDEDPDSFAKSHSDIELQEYIAANENDFIAFKAKVLMKDAEGDPQKKALAVRDIINSIAIIPDGLLRVSYIQKCSDLIKINEKSLNEELNLIRKKNSETEQKKKDQVKSQPIVEDLNREVQYPEPPAEKEIIKLLLNHSTEPLNFFQVNAKHRDEVDEVHTTIGNYVISDIKDDEILFTNPIYQIIFNEAAELIQQKKESEVAKYFSSHRDDRINKIAIDLMLIKHHLSDNWQKKHNIQNIIPTMDVEVIIKICYTLKLYKMDEAIMGLQRSLSTEPESNHTNIIEEISNYQNIKKELSSYLSVAIWK